jgi:hypothetical protein
MLPSLRINVSQPEEFLQRLSTVLPMIEERTLAILDFSLPSVVKGVFEGILISAAPNFPDVYAEHILSVLDEGALPIQVEIAGYTINVNMNISMLGTTEELTRGYHRHALSAEKLSAAKGISHKGVSISSYYIELPWEGEPPFSPYDRRKEFWEVLVKGGTYFTHGRPSRAVSTAGLYDETLLNRIDVWGASAPEWLILQWGSKETEPFVKPQPLLEELETTVQEYCTQIFNEQVRAALGSVSVARQVSSTEYMGAEGVSPIFVKGKYSVRGAGSRFTKLAYAG